ncbi:MAG: transposase [Spirochaetales bacterium]|nr:transposase [Spirochaetales bacterium]
MRKPRQLREHAKYHVTARANRQEMIFHSEVIKQLFLETISRAKRKFNFTIYHFCIMGNHIHFILQPHKGQNLSRIMQWILSVFAVRFNSTFKLKGHVWYDRFTSKIIESVRQFISTFEYITHNPQKANLVKDIFLYEYCALNHYKHSNYKIVDPPDTLLLLLFPQYMMQQLQITD